MSMLDFPLFKGDTKPKAVNAQGYNAEQQPQNPFAHKLSAVAVKAEPSALDYSVLNAPVIGSKCRGLRL